jgi:hypothetical protein
MLSRYLALGFGLHIFSYYLLHMVCHFVTLHSIKARFDSDIGEFLILDYGIGECLILEKL